MQSADALENEIIGPVLAQLKRSMFFYLVYTLAPVNKDVNNTNIIWRQIIMLENNPQVVINDLKFNTNGIMKDTQNFQNSLIQLGATSQNVRDDALFKNGIFCRRAAALSIESPEIEVRF